MSYPELLYRFHEYYEQKIFYIQYKFKSGICSAGTFSYQQFTFTRSSSKCLPSLECSKVFELDQQKILEGKHLCFSWEWQWVDTKDIWNISLENGNKWPAIYYNKIAYRQGNKTGDLRLVWEASRLQQLVNLSLLVDVDDGALAESVSEKIVQQFEHWVENNSFLTGAHYISSMECSLRLLSVIISFDNIRTHNKVSNETWNTLLSFVWRNASYVSKRISLYSSAGNHTIAECSGLLYAAVLFSEFKEARKWKAVAERILFTEFKRQVNSDGGGIEQAFCYQAFILDLFGLVIKLYESHNLKIPNDLLDLYKTSCQFLNTFANSYDELPSIGDSDNGYALSKYLNIIWDENYTNDGLTVFEETGYSVYKNNKIKQQLIFDHGSLGMPPSFGHSHADALSIVLKSGSDIILLDPGTYTYTGDAAWREYFRSTRAHNTITVNGFDQSKQESSFIWSKPYVSKLHNNNSSSSNVLRMLAYHDGYKTLGIRHWRGIVIFPEGNIIVWDFLEGRDEFDLQLNWHLGALAEKSNNGYCMNTHSGKIELQIDGGVVTICEAEVVPIFAWHSPKYGIKKPLSTLSVNCHTELPARFITKIIFDENVIDDEIMDDEISVLEGWIK